MLSPQVVRREYLFLPLVIVLGIGLRLVGLQSSGITYMDDSRAYVGPTIVRTLADHRLSAATRLGLAYRASIEQTGARPALAWFAAAGAALGLPSLGDLYIPFALCGALTIPLVFLLCRTWFGLAAGLFAALWIATSAAHVNYSRSALPPAPATLVMVLGLLALCAPVPRVPWRGRVLGAGLCFALATAFHPGYVLYLVVPALVVVLSRGSEVVRATRRRARRDFIRDVLVDGALLVLPTPALMLLYDLPGALLDAASGRSPLAEAMYVRGWWDYLHNPTVLRAHEGLTYWPRYLLAAEHAAGAVVLAVTLLAALAPASDPSERRRRLLLALWLVVPWVLWAVTPTVISLGRLYAPLLPAVACLVGYGAARACAFATARGRTLGALTAAGFALAIAVAGISASWRLIRSSGQEPALGRVAAAIDAREVIAFVRSDANAFPHSHLELVYTPDELHRAYCRGETDLLLLSPGSFYLVLRHRDYLFRHLRLTPVRTYPNPYLERVRLMEEPSSPEHALVRRRPEFARLGLFRIVGGERCG